MNLKNIKSLLTNNLQDKASILIGIMICFLAVTSKSIWIDEGITFYFINSSSLEEVLKKLFLTTYSEAYMPGYILLHWIYCLIVGTSEYAMRSFNIIFGAVIIFIFFRMSTILEKREYYWLLVVQPFFWYYMNEARPYTMLMAFSSVLCLELIKNIKFGASHVNLNRITCCIIVLNLSSLLSFVFTGIYVLMFLLINNREYLLKIKLKLFIIVSTNFLIGLYFLYRLVNGTSASKSWDFSYKNVAYAMSDILGYSGIIISKDELIKFSHEGGLAILSQCLKSNGILIILLTMVYLYIFYNFVKLTLRGDKRLEKILLSIAFIALGSQIAISLLFSWPFWGRHIFYMLPLLALILGLSVGQMSRVRSRVAFFALISILGFSSFNIRFTNTYEKDDYAKAAQIAKMDSSLNQNVLWVANDICGQYYKLDFDGAKIKFWDQYHDTLPFKVVPTTIIYSKKHVFDSSGVIENWIAMNSYYIDDKFPGFTIYKKL